MREEEEEEKAKDKRSDDVRKKTKREDRSEGASFRAIVRKQALYSLHKCSAYSYFWVTNYCNYVPEIQASTATD